MSSYEWLSAREHALHRPDTYAGSVVPTEHACHVFDLRAGVATRRDVQVTVAPALLKVSDEVIVNAIDNHVRDETQKNIRMTFEPSGVFEVSNDGATIPIDTWKDTTRYIPEILFGEMMSGENFDDGVQRVVGGRNGIGVKIAAILSEWFEVVIVNLSDDNVVFRTTADPHAKLLSRRVADQEGARALFASERRAVTKGRASFARVGEDGRCDKGTLVLVDGVVYHNHGPLCYAQRFEKNLSVTCPPTIARATAKDRHSSTTVRWKVDLARLHMCAPLSDDVVAVLCARGYDAAACTHARVAVSVNGARIPCKTIRDYAIAMGGDWIGRDAANAADAFGAPGVDVCAVKATDDAPGTCVGFVNGIRCSSGTHVDAVLRRIGEALAEVVGKKTKRATTTIPANQLLRHVTLVVAATVVNPAFSSQTKERLAMRADRLGYAYSCSPSFVRALERAGVVQALCDSAHAQDERSVTKAVRSDRARVSAIPKYERALKLQSKHPCALYITEGDSAKALAVAGFSVIGRDHNGVFPLKGKLVNVNDMSPQAALKNKEVLHLTQILGLDPSVSYTRERAVALPYRRLVIFTDQDSDGSHITGLILNWLQTFFPTLLDALPDFVCRFATPIIRARVAGESRAFFSQVEYRRWLAGRTPTAVKYYKGLGTSDTDDAKRYFSNLDEHLIVMRHTGTACADAVHTFFNARRTRERKEILARVDPDSFVDYSHSETSWADFLHKEMVHFGTADNRRSLPNAIDGLKPSQRKVLAHALHRKKGETRVGQFSSATAESMCYHHGEASLVQTVVNMAQPWMGANNVALLKPLGMFGARHMPRTEHSAERYIYTEQHEIARKLFRHEDDAILHKEEEDGRAVEPTVFAPIVAYLLVNGADGIGTGWRCFCPSYDPREIVRNTRLLVDDAEARLPPMTPWYFGFKGTIARKDDDTHVCTGVWTVETDTTVRITELPPKVWTTPYIEWIRENLVGDTPRHFVVDVVDSSTHDDVNLLIKTKPDAGLATRDLVKDLKLSVTIDTRQLNFFDANGNLRHYDGVEDIMREHAAHRRHAYERRKAASIVAMAHEHAVAINKSRFVQEVCDGHIVPSEHTSEELRAWLRSRDYYDVDDFKYLEKDLGIFSMTRDASTKLKRHAEALSARLEAMKSTTIEQMWHTELGEFEEELAAYMHAVEAKRMSAASEAMDKKKKKKRKAGAP